MNEIWKREIDKVYMSDVVCLDKETVEKIEDGHRMGAIFSRNPSEGSVVFYKKREWVGLTDEEVSKIIDDEIGFNSCWGPENDFARAIEAKLKEKNGD
jgi:hypothetical protein